MKFLSDGAYIFALGLLLVGALFVIFDEAESADRKMSVTMPCGGDTAWVDWSTHLFQVNQVVDLIYRDITEREIVHDSVQLVAGSTTVQIPIIYNCTRCYFAFARPLEVDTSEGLLQCRVTNQSEKLVLIESYNPDGSQNTASTVWVEYLTVWLRRE